MGYNDRVQNRKDDKGKAAEIKRRRRASGVGGGSSADWMDADADLLRRAIEIVAHMGGALRLGYTRDGGAFAVGIYGDGEPFTEYIPPSQSIDEYLKGVIEDYGG